MAVKGSVCPCTAESMVMMKHRFVFVFFIHMCNTNDSSSFFFSTWLPVQWIIQQIAVETLLGAFHNPTIKKSTRSKFSFLPLCFSAQWFPKLSCSAPSLPPTNQQNNEVFKVVFKFHFFFKISSSCAFLLFSYNFLILYSRPVTTHIFFNLTKIN